MHDVDGALTRQYGVLGRMAAGVQTSEESPDSTEQGARRKPGKRGNALTVPPHGVGVRATAREQQKRAGRFGGPDETGNPPCCNLRSGRTQPIPVANGGSPRPKVESSREGDDAARPGFPGWREMAISAATREQNPAYAPDTPDAHCTVVPLAQSAERRPVEPDVTGSSPVRHPISSLPVLVCARSSIGQSV